MAVHNDLGKKGEYLAKRHLEGLGYEILDENWTFGKAEVDLIAYNKRLLIFAEVKTRSTSNFGLPQEFVTPAKQKMLAFAATEYINLMNFKGEVRFDIIAVLFDKNGGHRIQHLEDAFWPE